MQRTWPDPASYSSGQADLDLDLVREATLEASSASKRARSKHDQGSAPDPSSEPAQFSEPIDSSNASDVLANDLVEESALLNIEREAISNDSHGSDVRMPNAVHKDSPSAGGGPLDSVSSLTAAYRHLIQTCEESLEIARDIALRQQRIQSDSDDAQLNTLTEVVRTLERSRSSDLLEVNRLRDENRSLRDDLYVSALRPILGALFGMYDDLQSLSQNSGDKSVHLILIQFGQMLQQYFDVSIALPNVGDLIETGVHEAVGTMEADDASTNTIASVLRPAFVTSDGVILRKAAVFVSRPSQDSS